MELALSGVFGILRANLFIIHLALSGIFCIFAAKWIAQHPYETLRRKRNYGRKQKQKVASRHTVF